MSRRIAAGSLEFWQRFAPYASATWLYKHFPPEVGGLSRPGWEHNIRTGRQKYAEHDLPWAKTVKGIPLTVPDGPIPEPVYYDELPGGEAQAGGYKESVEILEGDVRKSDKLITMCEEDAKSKEFLLRAHGFDPAEWECVYAKHSRWHGLTKDADGDPQRTTLYSSKITVKPIVTEVDWRELAAVFDRVKPRKVKRPADSGRGLLEIFNTDMHFGNSTLEYYAGNLERTVEKIHTRRWAQVVIPIGSDLFHSDNFQNTTAHGTPQSSVDWVKAYDDALTYYSTVIEEALKQGDEVYLYYIPGNHDMSMSWMFCRALEAKYPQVIFDTRIEERKVHRFEDVAIGFTHGNAKTIADIDRVFMSEFSRFASATIREVHHGHIHHEVRRDKLGVVVCSLPTLARNDKWHREVGFVGSMKRFAAFVFEPGVLRGIEFL